MTVLAAAVTTAERGAPPGAPPGRPPGRRSPLTAVRALSPLAVLVLWQLASWSGLLPTGKLAGPTTVLRTGSGLITDGTLGPALQVSLQRVVIGFLVGAGVGIALGTLTGLSRWADALLDPVLQALRTLPFLGLIPLLILWFGIGEVPKVALVALGAAFPLYLNTYAGIRAVDRRLIEAATTLRLTRAQMLRHVILPGASGQVLVGLRQGLGVAWLSLIVAEQVNANAGLGQMIMDARDFLRTDVIVVGLLIYAGLGLLTDAGVRYLERKALAWRP
jgi:sulfonate transport system permease protein